MAAWIVWGGLLLFVIVSGWETLKTYSGRLSAEDSSRVQDNVEEIGKIAFIILDVGGFLALTILLIISLITNLSKFHLLWLAPLVLAVQIVTGKVIRMFRQIKAGTWEPILQAIFSGLILILVFGLLTAIQLWRIKDGTAWIIFRFGLISVPAIALTGIGSLVGLLVFLWGLLGRQAE